MAVIQRKIVELLEDNQLFVEIFNARCHDSGEATSLAAAKIFKEELMKRNVKAASTLMNLSGLRLGPNSIHALSCSIHQKKGLEKLNLSDNAITDYCIGSIERIINNGGPKLHTLNLGSNMISGHGMELWLEDLVNNTTLKHLYLGFVESSLRKNSLGI